MRPASIIVFCLLLTGSASVLQSCCKAVCIDDDIFAIDFQGFNATEMEKIKILRFNQDNFSSAIDSYYVSTTNIIINNSTRVYPDKPLLSDFDFKINVEKAGLSYSVSDFQKEKENCSCGPGTFEKIVGYKLNGVQFSAANKYALEIKK